MKVRIVIGTEKWYLVYEIVHAGGDLTSKKYFSSGEYTEHAQEIDTKLLDEINACFKEFDRLQETLSDLYRTQKASYND